MTDLATTQQFEFKPLAPVGDPANAKAMLRSERMLTALREILPAFSDDADPEKHVARLIAQAGLAYMANRTLRQCTQLSFFEAMLSVAETGLSLSRQSGEAYLVPFRDKKRGVMQCQFMPGYRGLIKLAVQTGSVSRVDSVVVFESDEFKYWEDEHGPHINHTPDLSIDRTDEETIAYIYMRAFPVTGGVRVEVMNRQQIEKIRVGAPGKDSPAWKYHWAEMGRKTVMKRGLKTIPQSTTDKAVTVLERALELDNRAAGFDNEVLDELLEQRRKSLTTEWDRRMAAEDGIKAPDPEREADYNEAWSAFLAVVPAGLSEAELEKRWDELVQSACPGRTEAQLAPADWGRVLAAIRAAGGTDANEQA